MKHSILLPVLALCLLCGCKSNVFLKQRYTHLPHAHHKKEETKLAKRELPSRAQELKDAPVVKGEAGSYQSLAFASATEKTAEQVSSQTKTPVYKKITRPYFNAGNKMISLAKTEVEKSQEKTLSSSKTFKAKAHTAAGLLNTLFKIVLFCVILAVLVAVIIILVLI